MTEILTESFCERCGSRYTFEAAVRKDRLRQVKVLSRGLKTFVLDDKTSFDEALAAARSDTDREATSSQLDAFHKTFNFCMQCRQYTCPDCWNEAEGRCLTCAPLGHQVAPATFPGLEPAGGLAAAPAPTNGRAPLLATNGAATAAAGAAAAATNGHAAQDEVDAFDPIARLDALSRLAPPTEAPPIAEPVAAEPVVETVIAEPVPAEPVPAEPLTEALTEPVIADPVVEPMVEPEVVAAITEPDVPEPAVEPVAEPVVEAVIPEPVVEEPIGAAFVAEPAIEAVIPEPVVEEPIVAAFVAEPAIEAVVAEPVAEPLVAEPVIEVVPIEPVIEPLDELVFEPLDDHVPTLSDEPVDEVVLDLSPVAESSVEPVIVAEPIEPETDHRAAAAATATGALLASVRPGQSLDDAIDAYEREESETVAAVEPEPEPVVVAEPVTAAEPEVVALVEPEPEPEPVLVAAVEPEPEPVVVAEPAQEPIAAEEQPAPPVAAPAAPTVDVVEQPTWTIVAPDPTQTDGAPAVAPVVVPTAPDPQWPTTPEWPAQQVSPGLPFLGRPAVPTGGVEALWAASDREVTTAPAGDRPVAAVQACVSCGLSLSATARFCRRCGTAQH